MSATTFKVLKKAKVEDTTNDDKSEEQVIQISVSTDDNEVYPTAVSPGGLDGTDNIKDGRLTTSLTDDSPVKFEIGLEPDCNPTSSSQITSETTSKSQEDNVFMIPPLLRVRQFSVQERLPISVDEIQRRIRPPESLSQALLLSLLRLNKERAKQLRKALRHFGITELPNRSAVVSSFSRLSEAEAQGLAEDYYFLASRFMKVKEMNKALTSQNGGDVNFAPKARRTRIVLDQILSELEGRKSDLEVLTHGFSPLILRAVFNIIIEILTFKENEAESTTNASKMTL